MILDMIFDYSRLLFAYLLLAAVTLGLAFGWLTPAVVGAFFVGAVAAVVFGWWVLDVGWNWPRKH